ncbi:transcriptional regulator GcvA [Acetobacteraceae bacterium ESL0709]|nr:transcriptional regulator GcvA [Acetobacteraceae bacterium ESL0697]MDF7678896.1 transcriptional regulator GcvA [Acetobacteraceae bacterium ESL0709]
MKAPIYLNALRAFEASARHQSFAAAAVELNVTPAAVGQLVRQLEEWLGVVLFQRHHSGRIRLTMTDSAQSALPAIQMGFDQLNLGIERLKEGSSYKTLTVTVSPAFATKWLLPRIDKFQETHPDLELRLDISRRSVDFTEHDIDIGVRYGMGNWPGLKSERLMDEEIYPVCSPALLRARESLITPHGLLGEILLHDSSMEDHSAFPSWKTWLQKVGLSDVTVPRGMKINNSAAVLQAAIEGHGVALARSIMAQADLAAGRLVRLYPDICVPCKLAYYVVYRPEYASITKFMAFRDWLFEQAEFFKKEER